MANKTGTITAVSGTAGGAVGAADAAGAQAPAAQDTSLPDPTSYARWALLVLLVLAVGLALLLNDVFHATAKEFKPSTTGTANFALFAGFYVAAQVIERLLELVSPLIPHPLMIGWKLPASVKGATAKAAQVKADRAKIVLGVAAMLGVAASCGFGLFFLAAIGMKVSHTVDSFFTGLTVAGGTKPLHDFISLLQNQSSPVTGTGTKADIPQETE